MSSTAVPIAIPMLLRAIESRDMDAIHASFTPDATIADEGETVHGRAGVERWATRVLGYALTFIIDDVSESDGETVVTTTTSGEFPGSPRVFRWHMTFADDRVASLRIEL